ncbi:hypothetical protein V1506DRAFT_509015 [Lipomyces tetrasporus]
MKQDSYFGPFPLSYSTLLADDDPKWDILGEVTQYIKMNQLWKPFSMAEDDCLTVDDREFIRRIMKLDPRDRPTASELLRDPWFEGL